jgi:hypothetical protein
MCRTPSRQLIVSTNTQAQIRRACAWLRHFERDGEVLILRDAHIIRN